MVHPSLQAFETRLRNRTGTGLRVTRMNDPKNPTKAWLKIDTERGSDGPVDVLVVKRSYRKLTRMGLRKTIQEDRIRFPDLAAVFRSTLPEASTAIVLLTATHKQGNRRIRIDALRIVIDADGNGVVPCLEDIMTFLRNKGNFFNGILTSIIPSDGSAVTGGTLFFFEGTFDEKGLVGVSSCNLSEIRSVCEDICKVGQAAAIVGPVFVLLAAMVSKFETMNGIKSDFLALVARWSKIEGSLVGEAHLKRKLLGLAEEFFFKSGWRRYMASPDFQLDLNRVANEMDWAVQQSTLHRTIEIGSDVKDVKRILGRTALNVTEKEFDWMNVKSMLQQTRSTIGREDELSEVRAHVEKSGTITALAGLAGCGKSHLAREAAGQWSSGGTEKENRIVLFVNASNEASYRASVLQIMEWLGLEPAFQKDGNPIPTKGLSSCVHRRIAEAPRNVKFLVILDDAPVAVDGPDILNEWFGLADDCSWSNKSVIVTSQSAAYSGETSLGHIEAMQVNPLPTEDSLALLTKNFPTLLEKEDEKEAATRLVAGFLHNLPVAILAVSGLILRRSWTFRGYLRRLQSKKVEAGVDSVKDVLQDALAEARRDASLARVLDVAAFVSPDDIPLSLLRNEELLEQLCTLNLVQVVEDERYSMHGLIQAAARIDRTPTDAIVALNKALGLFNHLAPDTWPAATTMIPHTETLRRVVTGENVLSKLSSEDIKSYACVLDKCGNVYMRVLCKLESSRVLYEESLRLKRTVYANDDVDIAETLCSLGLVYESLGDYLQAKGYYEQALAMERAAHGETANHENIARLLNCLAIAFGMLDNDGQAKEHYEQALEMYRALYGATANHANIAKVLGNLGLHYLSPGSYEQAKGLLEEALVMMRTVYGTKTPHAEIGWILRMLGRVHRRLRKYEQALKYIEESLAMMRAVYGPTANHVDVAHALYTLGEVYLFTDKSELAKDHFKRALEMYKVVYGSTASHSKVAFTLNMLGGTYQSLDQFEVAKDYFEQALAMFRAVYGATTNHVRIAYVLKHLGHIYHKLGQFEVAKDHYYQALRMLRIVFGGDESDPSIQSCLKRLRKLGHSVAPY